MQATEDTRKHLIETQEIALTVDAVAVDRVVQLFHDTRERGGRIFFLGIGGGAGNATHAVNDFRKIADIECYAPTDNVSELTARINDEGWDSCYAQWLRVSHLRTLLGAADGHSGAVLVDDEGYPQWLIGCWQRRLLAAAAAGYTGGSLRGLLAPLDPAWVVIEPDAGEPPPWLDCDTHGDLRLARAWPARR